MTKLDFLAESLGHWRYIRGGLVAELDNIPEDKFEFRPSPEVRSVLELGQHVLEGSMMMVGELLRESPDFQRKSHSEIMEPYAARAREAGTKANLLPLLGSQLEEGIAGFTRLGEAAMLEPVRNFDGSTWSRMQWFFHGMTEEMYHRGQLVTYARLLGRVPALTQRIQAAQS